MFSSGGVCTVPPDVVTPRLTPREPFVVPNPLFTPGAGPPPRALFVVPTPLFTPGVGPPPRRPFVVPTPLFTPGVGVLIGGGLIVGGLMRTGGTLICGVCANAACEMIMVVATATKPAGRGPSSPDTIALRPAYPLFQRNAHSIPISAIRHVTGEQNIDSSFTDVKDIDRHISKSRDCGLDCS